MSEKSALDSTRRPAAYQPPQSVAELLERYARGERYFANAEIPDGADLDQVCLAGANLENAWLNDASLREADLRQVNFSNANLKCSDFRGADLEGACFCGALIEATDFHGAKVTKANFVGASYYGFTFTEKDSIEFLKP